MPEKMVHLEFAQRTKGQKERILKFKEAEFLKVHSLCGLILHMHFITEFSHQHLLKGLVPFIYRGGTQAQRNNIVASRKWSHNSNSALFELPLQPDLMTYQKQHEVSFIFYQKIQSQVQTPPIWSSECYSFKYSEFHL